MFTVFPVVLLAVFEVVVAFVDIDAPVGVEEYLLAVHCPRHVVVESQFEPIVAMRTRLKFVLAHLFTSQVVEDDNGAQDIRHTQGLTGTAQHSKVLLSR